jgi:hypothetical protein
LLVDLSHPQQNSTDDNRKRHDHEPWLDTEQSWDRQFPVIAKLEKIILDEWIDFRIETGTDQDT